MTDQPDERTAKGAWKRPVGKARKTPKGRQLDDQAAREVAELLGRRSRRRDLLIEHLHLIQDAYGALSPAHLRALAEEMRLSQAEVYEVATFYAHFDVLRDGEDGPAALTLRVCDGLPCALAGSEELLRRLAALYGPSGEARVVRAPCMGRCDTAPTVEVGHHHVDEASLDDVRQAVEAGRIEPTLPRYEVFQAYREQGGYDTLAELRAGKRSEDAVEQALFEAGLRGMGGAGFPAGRKWAAVRNAHGPRYVAVNADEGEPGTLKDRYLLERMPHAVLEGMLIAAWAVDAERCFFYVRDEYPAVLKLLKAEIAALEAASIAPPGYIELRRGAGAYICGEESAMIESIEGKRGLPRHRPPYVAAAGIFDRPTLVHNVETLYWVAQIARGGPEIYNAHGANGRVGLRHYSVSGRVRQPGVKLAPAGITIRALIDEYCGGMADGHAFKAYLPGGASGGLLPASLDEVPLDFDTIQPHGGFIGSAAVIVLSDQDDMREAGLNLMRFFADESCGQCTPCRVGCAKAVALMEQPAWNASLLEELGQVMEGASICGLGQAAPNVFRSVLLRWPEEVGATVPAADAATDAQE